MKKFCLAMLALGMSLTAAATDYYLVGNFNNWGLKDAKGKFTAVGDGTYTLEYQGTLASGFKINDGSWNDAENYGSSYDGEPITPGTTFNLTLGSGAKNIGTTGNLTNPKFTFNPTAKTLLVAGEEVAASYTYYLWGNFDGSKDWSKLDLTENNGKWVSAKTAVKKCDFGIRKWNTTTDTQDSWLSSAGSATVTLDTPLSLKVEGTNFSIAEGEYVFTVDPKAMTLTVSGDAQGGGEDPQPPVTPVEGNKVYWDNSVAKWATPYIYWWGAQDPSWPGVAMTATSDANVWVYDLPEGATGCLFNAGDGDATKTKDMTVVAGHVYNQSGDQGVYTPNGGGDDPNPPVPPVTEDYSEWWINVYGPFNDWKNNGVQVNAENISVTSDLDLMKAGDDGRVGFKVKVWNGSADVYYCVAGSKIALDTWTQMDIDGYDAAPCVVEGGEAGTLYNVYFNAATKEVKVEKAGTDAVSEVAVAEGEAVYYNLQGVQVANPVHGIYVKVANGKASKVVVK